MLPVWTAHSESGKEFADESGKLAEAEAVLISSVCCVEPEGVPRTLFMPLSHLYVL